ncbi:hypothetical protein [Bacteroides acidifaciens]|uniref:hypothetical protein n=1 Tax=Bacteroides acidifaciens TaxID=85831 RepID=UPI0025B0F413|nr:hypothetical protein [Bacteroides acidifaciens]
MNKFYDSKNFKIPEMAKGTVVPPYVYRKMQEEEERKQQIDDLKRIADSAESQAKSSAIQADLAVKTSKKADVKGWIAVIFSGIALLIEFAANHKEIIDYINQILQ